MRLDFVRGIVLVLALFALLGKIEKAERTVALQEERIKGLEQSELQMRGQWQPPDTVFIVPDSARVW